MNGYDSSSLQRRGRAFTRSGIDIGSTAAEVRRTYPGRITRRSHEFEGSHDFLAYVSPDVQDRGLVVIFALDERDRVYRISAGQEDWANGFDDCY